MKTIVLTNAEGTLNAQYKTDLIGNEGNFTILAKTKEDDLETKAGIGFTDTIYNLDHFKTIAEDNNLLLQLIDDDAVVDVIDEATDFAFTTLAALTAGTQDVAYSETIEAEGGSGSYTFATEDTLPAGLTLSEAGVLAGTPTAADAYAFTITATDTYGASITRDFTLTIGV